MKAKGLFGWVFVLAVAIAASASAAKLSSSVPKGWIEDFEAAKKEAAAGGKYILLAFSGSDWCGWCKKLEKEVFSQSEFVRDAQKAFVLTMIDNPRDKSILSKVAERQNQELTEKFNVRGFPCAVLCDAEGTEIKRFGGYRKGGPSAYLEMLEDAVKDLPKPKGKAVSADDPPVCAIWVVRLRPGALEKYRALFNSVAQKVRETEGCEAFMLLQDVQTKAKGQARPRTALTCIEKWQSRSAFEANRASDAMKEFDAQAARLRYGADLYVASELVEP